MQCQQCGAELKPSSRFCLECGHAVEQEPGGASLTEATPEDWAAVDATASAPTSLPAPGASEDSGEGEEPTGEDSGLLVESTPTAAFDVASLSASDVAATLAPAPGEPRSAVGYAVLLTFGDGSAVIVDEDAVLGRKPLEVAAEENLLAVPLNDPLKTSSRVHLRMFLTPQGVNIVDAHSGNGTAVEHAGVRYDAQPGQAFWIEPGDRLRLGDVSVDVALA